MLLSKEDRQHLRRRASMDLRCVTDGSCEPRNLRATGVTLNRVIHVQDLAKRYEWVDCLLHVDRIFPVPTQVVLRSFEDRPSPKQGRIYYTPYVTKRGVIWTGEDYHRFRRALGTGTWISTPSYNDSTIHDVLLAEYWQCHGSDGHTDYHHRGWVFVGANDLAAREQQANLDWRDHRSPTQWAIELLVGDRL